MSDYYIPPELVIQILLKLPVKTLIRFRSVCKSWQSLITSPTFISTHLSNSENHVLFRRQDAYNKGEYYSLVKDSSYEAFRIDSSSELKFPLKPTYARFRIAGSCDGLVCLWGDDLPDYPSQPITIIWNPSIRNHRVLPNPIIHPNETQFCVLGFGVANHIYKVVRLVCCWSTYDFERLLQAEILSLGTGKWRKVGAASDLRVEFHPFMCRQVFLEGFLHWPGYEYVGDQVNHSCRRRCSILTFHVGDEVFGEVMFPDELAIDSMSVIGPFMNNGESLGVINHNSMWSDVWIMKEYGMKESWTKLYRIKSFCPLEKVLGFGGETLFFVRQDRLAAYILDTNRVKDSGIYGTPWSFYIGKYVESLLLLGGYVGAADDNEN